MIMKWQTQTAESIFAGDFVQDNASESAIRREKKAPMAPVASNYCGSGKIRSMSEMRPGGVCEYRARGGQGKNHLHEPPESGKPFPLLAYHSKIFDFSTHRTHPS